MKFQQSVYMKISIPSSRNESKRVTFLCQNNHMNINSFVKKMSVTSFLSLILESCWKNDKYFPRKS